MYKHLDTHNAIPGPYFHGEHESATEIVVQGFVYLQSARYCFPNNIERPLLPLQAGIARSPSPSARADVVGGGGSSYTRVKRK